MKKKIRDNDIQSEALSIDDLFQIRLELQSKVLKQMIAKVDSHGIENENLNSEVKTTRKSFKPVHSIYNENLNSEVKTRKISPNDV
ncbi:MAG: hypothetical protein Q8O88_02795 [bacterium]|nr:hypothetical protein [bacterium]